MATFNRQVTNVFITNNYSKFKKAPNNRKVNKKVIQIIQTIMMFMVELFGVENAFFGSIIVVKRKGFFYILDGQHRFEAAVLVGIPIRYEIREMSDEHFNLLMIRLNTSSHSWTTNDYALSHANSAKRAVSETYSTILELKREFTLTFSNLCHLISNSKNLDKFKDGKLKIQSMSDLKKRIGFLMDYRKKLGVEKAFLLRNLVEVINMKEYAKNHKAMLNRIAKSQGVNFENETKFKRLINTTFNEVCKPKTPLSIKREYNLQKAA